MIERRQGEDADLIIEDKWPHRYNEDKLLASAVHHRQVVAEALDTEANPELVTAHNEATNHNAGDLAQAVATKTRIHLRETELSTARHQVIATELESFAETVISSKNRINQAVDTFTSDWAQAGHLAKINNWYQHEYNGYRTQLIDTGRSTVAAALHDLTAADGKCLATLNAALDS